MAIPRSRAVALIIATAALGTGLSACGGTEASTTTAEATPTEVTARATTTAPAVAKAPAAATTAAVTDPIATTGTDAPGSAVARFGEDIRVIRAALTDIGAAVAAHPKATGAMALSATVAASLQAFDRAVENMKGYTVGSAAVEAYRLGIIAAAPALSDALRQFDDSVQQAGDSNSDATLIQAENQVGQALADFGTKVLQGNG